jgi:hypothetical protein
MHVRPRRCRPAFLCRAADPAEFRSTLQQGRETVNALPLAIHLVLKQPVVTGGLTVLVLYAFVGRREP